MEVKKPIFKRQPPGDRWVEIDSDGTTVYPSLTEAIEYHFQKAGTRQFYIDAAAGLILKVEEETEPVVPPKKFSIYGDGY